MSGRRVHRSGARRCHHRRMHGGGFMDFMSKASGFLKNPKLISTIANGLDAAGVPIAGTVGSIAGKLGYGRTYRRHRRGGALRLAGGSLGLAGGRRRHHRR